MRELIDQLRAAKAPTFELDGLATVALFGGELSPYGLMWRESPVAQECMPYRLTASVDVLNSVFEHLLPGCGRISGKGRVSEGEPMYGFQIFATDLSPDPLEPIGAGEHDLEAYAYLIAMLKAVEAKRGGAV
jgi:hypothetical protein